MAKKPQNNNGKKPPKKPKTAAEEKQNFKKELEARIASYQEETETDGFLQRRNVRTALGIGNLKKWAKEFEDGYSQTAATPKKPVDAKKPYSEPPEEKPLIRKVNREQPRKRKPPDRRKGGK